MTPGNSAPLSQCVPALPRAVLQALQQQLDQAPAGPVSLRVACDLGDPLTWLAGQHSGLRWFWTNRQRQRTAAWGIAWRGENLADTQAFLATAGPGARCYGGWAFRPDHTPQTPWQHWPGSGFFWPRWELRETDAGWWLQLNLRNGQDPQEQALAWETLGAPEPLTPHTPELGPLHHQPDAAGWRCRIEAAQQAMHNAPVEKIVLSRQSRAECAELGLDRMQALLDQQRQAYHFWCSWRPGEVLWGASPERLYARQGLALETEALAGTRPLPRNAEAAAALRSELLASTKEQAENEKVLEHLLGRLKPLVSREEASPLRVIPAGPVQHLYRQVRAELHPGVSDAQLISALHPTPAVCGLPAATVREMLPAFEEHERGWYTGALGWVEAEAAEWSVVLRAALWQQPWLYFYTGAGIMPDSQPDAEWDELDAKLSSLLNVLGGPVAPCSLTPEQAQEGVPQSQTQQREWNANAHHQAGQAGL
ncbi:MAG: isochorismate synthase [Candidatus Sericytochromatia bacterium]